MLHALDVLQGWIAPAAMERLTLLLNHVLASEPAATARLAPHAGKSVRLQLQGWPALLPAPPALAFRVTPAGLFEWQGVDAGTADLALRVDASNPALLLAQAAGGGKPEAAIEGDAALAAEVSWLLDNLRWDVATDLERVMPLPMAQALLGAGRAAAAALRAAAQAVDRLRRRTP